MPARIPKERFLILLSHAREATEKATKICDELVPNGARPPSQGRIGGASIVSQSVLAKLDQV